MRVRRAVLMGALGLGLLVGAGEAGAAEPPYMQPIPAEVLKLLQPAQRTAAGALQRYCAKAKATPEAADLAAEKTRALGLLRGLAGRDGLWLGLVEEVDVGRDDASMTVQILPGILVQSATRGFLSFDPYDTRARAGSRAYRAMVELHGDDVVAFRATPFHITAADSCHVHARFTELLKLR